MARGPTQKISPFPITGNGGEDASNNPAVDNDDGDENNDDDDDDEGRKSKQVASSALIEYFNQRSVSGPAKPQKQRHSVIKDHKFSTGKFS